MFKIIWREERIDRAFFLRNLEIKNLTVKLEEKT